MKKKKKNRYRNIWKLKERKETIFHHEKGGRIYQKWKRRET